MKMINSGRDFILTKTKRNAAFAPQCLQDSDMHIDPQSTTMSEIISVAVRVH